MENCRPHHDPAPHHASPDTQIIRRPWKKRITDDLDGGFGIQMFAHLAKKKSIHSRNHIASSVAYVKDGKENNIE